MEKVGKCFFIFLGISQFLFAKPICDHKIDPNALSELLSAFDIQDSDDIIAETQKKWLRDAKQERWEMKKLSEEKNQFILDWSKKHDLFFPWTPTFSRYDVALILGATTSRMQMRLNYLKKLWEKGVRFDEIVWLTGDRELDKRVDDFISFCKTESEAAKILWENADLPKEMRDLSIRFIAVPMKKEDGVLIRPNTQDTLIAWINTISRPCRALFISNQPYCGYQFAVIKHVLPVSIHFDVAGEGIDIEHYPNAEVILDTIARWLYQQSLSHNFCG